MAGKKVDFIVGAFVEEYIRDVLKLRSSKAGVAVFENRLNAVMADVLKEAGKEAKKKRKKTVLPRLMNMALDKHVGKKSLSWDEVVEHLMKLPASDLGKVSKAINARLKELKKRAGA